MLNTIDAMFVVRASCLWISLTGILLIGGCSSGQQLRIAPPSEGQSADASNLCDAIENECNKVILCPEFHLGTWSGYCPNSRVVGLVRAAEQCDDFEAVVRARYIESDRSGVVLSTYNQFFCAILHVLVRRNIRFGVANALLRCEFWEKSALDNAAVGSRYGRREGYEDEIAEWENLR